MLKMTDININIQMRYKIKRLWVMIIQRKIQW